MSVLSLVCTSCRKPLNPKETLGLRVAPQEQHVGTVSAFLVHVLCVDCWQSAEENYRAAMKAAEKAPDLMVPWRDFTLCEGLPFGRDWFEMRKVGSEL